MYEAKVLADSISPAGVRLITVQVTFPRFILAEVNTHRMLSRNSASSRAIPPEKIIQRVVHEPFVPETFNKRVKGMGVGEELSVGDQAVAKGEWLSARDASVEAATRLLEIDCDKSRINRLLEPFMWHTAIITATEWDNFFALRNHPQAQLEFQKIARLMQETMQGSEPQLLEPGAWHLPLVSSDGRDHVMSDDKYFWARVSAGRCARVSFNRHDEYETPWESYERCSDKLEQNGHLSPLEHPAQVPSDPVLQHRFTGNFKGWVQLRKLVDHEDNLVGHLEDRTDWESEEVA